LYILVIVLLESFTDVSQHIFGFISQYYTRYLLKKQVAIKKLGIRDHTFSPTRKVDRPLQLFHGRRAIALLASCRSIASFLNQGRSLFLTSCRSIARYYFFTLRRAIALFGIVPVDRP